MTDRETVEAALKGYLSKEMPAGTEICDPLWWAASIAKVVATALAQPNPICRDDGRCQYAIDHGAEVMGHCPVGKCCMPQPEQEPDAWRNAAIRLGEDLYSVGPNGYYDMTAKQWLDWALSVVNTAPPRKEWVGLTDTDLMKEFGYTDELLRDTAYRVEQLLKGQNT